MPLETYGEKRDFARTPEPPPDASATSEAQLRFVVQKHRASHLHYDFRLELDGVLKSWAVPKGPSLNPDVRRLAMMVEDHPIEYRSFEGIIPQGNYGAGTVMVWDEGVYNAVGAAGRAESEKVLRKGLAKGHLSFILHGDKLKGEFALVRTKSRADEERRDNGWLLIKAGDAFASHQDVTLWDRSVLTGRSLNEIAAGGGPEWHSQRGGAEVAAPAGAATVGAATVGSSARQAGEPPAAEPAVSPPTAGSELAAPPVRTGEGSSAARQPGPERVAGNGKGAHREERKTGPGLATGSAAAADAGPSADGGARGRSGLDLSRLDLTGAVESAPPATIKPMLATLTDEPFDRAGWLFELKWDGYRAIADVRADHTRLYSRNAKSFNERYPAIVADLQSLDASAVLDGEVVVLDRRGIPEFKLLQNFRESGEGTLVYFVFDILYLQGYDVRALPLVRRKALLRAVLPNELAHVRWSDYIEEHGEALFSSARSIDLEGIIAKDGASPYRPGIRGHDWLKVKTHLRQEAVIGGFTEPRGGRKELGALVLGVYEGDRLIYIGHTGGGFDQAELAHVKERLAPLATSAPAFAGVPATNAPVTWVVPKVVCEVRFVEWSQDGLMRQPIYIGLRDDVDPRSVHRERPMPIAKALAPRRYSARREKVEEVEIGGRVLQLKNLDKVYWPEQRFSKRDLINYYRGIAPLILPYLVDRPQSLHRFPNGIHGESFFQKNVAGQVPDWIRTVKIGDAPDAETYLLCQDEASLVYMANLGCIEMNPWNSRVRATNNPDFLVVDLDPLDIAFVEVVRAAQVVHEVLEAAETPHYVKTSGATGLHINVPLGARYTFEQAREFANIVGYVVNQRLPETTSLARSPSARKGKIYLDYLQNRRGQTMAAPYCLRPRPGAPVSTPLRWEEVEPGLSPMDYRMTNISRRIAEVGDLWEPVLGPGIDMQAGLRNLERLSRHAK